MPPFLSFRPAYQFCTVLYFREAFFAADHLHHRGVQLVGVFDYAGAVQPSRY